MSEHAPNLPGEPRAEGLQIVPATAPMRNPWMVAVWPGMAGVAINAGIYLLSKLDMDVFAELETGDLFDVDHVAVRGGLVQPTRKPRQRLFRWIDPKGKRDLVVFLGEAQPPAGKHLFCRELMAFAKKLGVERVLTFAAMATRLRPGDNPRVYGVATDREQLEEIKRLELEVLDEGNVGGLNGVLLIAAKEACLPGVCMLGEISAVIAQLPSPQASLAVLEAFATMAGIELDLSELEDQAKEVKNQLGQIVAQLESAASEQEEEAETEGDEGVVASEPAPEETMSDADRARIEALFEEAMKDRAKAFELKKTLDRLEAFDEYEDRFLDLFRKPETGGAEGGATPSAPL